jgi:hypothetical protein
VPDVPERNDGRSIRRCNDSGAERYEDETNLYQRLSEENEEMDTISTEESTTCSSSTCNDEHEEPTLFEILSTPLPPSHILFNDAEDFTADGLSFPYYNNVDSALVDLAMIY